MPQRINVSDFDLAGTLECGQAFRWQRAPEGWFTGVVGGRRLRVRQDGDTMEGDIDPHYFALDVSLPEIVATFPDDGVLPEAVKKHWGLRVLRQESWETLASFIASSTKQIVQIRQIVANLASSLGEDDAFPSVEVIARATHGQLVGCKLGFRAKYLHAAARAIDSGEVRLDKLPGMDYDRALEELMKLDGVGEKIAACTLLFSCGHNEAFPIDVWVERSLRRLYFDGKKIPAKKLREFTRSHFGPYAGWAQQYLFFQERTLARRGQSEGRAPSPTNA
jgi:N-glycosylase/DNA lyase